MDTPCNSKSYTETLISSLETPDGRSARPNGFRFPARRMQSQAVLIPTYDPTSEEAKTIAKALSDGAGNNLAASYVADLQNELGVYVDENMWRQVTGANAN